MSNKETDCSMLDSFEIRGEWWASDDVVSKFDGVLYCLDNKKVLKLDKRSSRKILNIANNFAGFTIHGVDRQKNKWSLFKCYPGNFNFLNGYSTLDITVNEIVKNAHLMSFDEIMVDKLGLSYSGLPASYLVQNLCKKYHNKNKSIILEWSPPKLFEVSLPELNIVIDNTSNSIKNTKLELKTYNLSLKKINEFTGQFHTSLNFIFDKPQVYSIIEHLEYKLRNLLIILHGIPVATTSIQIHSYNNSKVLEIINNYNTELESNLTIPLKLLKDENLLDEIVKNWFIVAEKFSLPIEIFCNLENSQNIHTQLYFKMLVQILESWHRVWLGDKDNIIDPNEYKTIKKWLDMTVNANPDINEDIKNRIKEQLNFANRHQLNTRLVMLFNEIPEKFKKKLFPDIDLAIKKIKDTRNYWTHLDSTSQSKSMSLNETTFANYALKLIFQILVLKELGIPEELIVDRIYNETPIFSNSQYFKMLSYDNPFNKKSENKPEIFT